MFRNPVTSLPADAITGQIQGTQIADGAITTPKINAGAITADRLDVNALNGKTITGSTVQTAASGRRVVLSPDGNTYWYTGHAQEVLPGKIKSEASGQIGSLSLYGPQIGDAFGFDYGLQIRQNGAGTEALFNCDAHTFVGDVHVAGTLAADNIAWGSVNITPVANTDTSVTVSGVNIAQLGSYRVLVTANSGFPSQVNSVTVNGITSDGFTVWMNRTNTTTTTIYWLMLGK
ncbi:hypothetical protein ACIQVT_34575 [Streptomyces sp. NPDC100445]|uniref:hypothetical protein n=1 Tax=Streptomyces sp. NPDC100445 TaxID=3366102 RepID=UPI003818506C